MLRNSFAGRGGAGILPEVRVKLIHMKLKSNLQAKILLLVVSTVLLVFLFIGIFVGIRNRNFAIKKAHEYTQLMAEKYAQNVTSRFHKHTGFVKAMADAQGYDQNRLTREADSLSKLMLKKQLANSSQYQSVWLFWKEQYYAQPLSTNEGWVLVKASKNYNTPQTLSQVPDFMERYAPNLSSAKIKIGEPFYENGKYLTQVTAPIMQAGQVKGYAGVTLDLTFFNQFINDASIYDGGFITVLTPKGKFIAHKNESFVGNTFSQNFPEESKKWPVEKNVAAGKRFEIKTNLENKSYYSFFVPVKVGDTSMPWSVEVTVPMHKILESSSKTIRSSVFVALIGLLIMVLVIWWISRRVSKPVRKVTDIMQYLSKGDIDNIDKLDVKSGDELEEMGRSVNHLIEGLKKTEMFALEIGNGNLDLEYSLLGENDQIGKALLDMRDNLKHNREEEKKRKEEEEKRNWTTHGIAKFGDILRQDSADMKTLGYNIMSNLIEYLKVNQGALFVLNDEDDVKQFELKTAIAYGRDKLIKQTINIGEGLVGRCAFEKKTIYLTDVPEDYINITSGLGTANPKSVLLVPCIINDEVYSVIELASFSPFQPHEIEFVEKLGESIASTISSVKISEKTNSLLSASQKQGEELAAQEEELRQNLEEMEATQEDLQRQMKTNAEMREKMEKQNALLDSLLRNLPDYIYFKDEESKFIRISDSMLKLFGADSVDEVIGKSDFDFQTKENAEKYYRDEKEIMEKRSGFTNVLQEEKMPDGSTIWNSVTKMPLIDENDKVIGTFGISKDVTDLKLIEIKAQEQNQEMQQNIEEMKATEENLKKQMELNAKMRESLAREKAFLDALLENAPEHIYFKDKDSKFIRFSKSMLDLFDLQSTDELLGKSDFDFFDDEHARPAFEDEQKIIETGKPIIDLLEKETHKDGSVTYVNTSKIPLKNEEGKIIGTFGISKDITQTKITEQELKNKQVELKGVNDAIKTSTYMVEYNTKGIITDVNDAVLELFKLKKDKLIGTHHKEGIDWAKAKKTYDKFWADLLAGKHRREHSKLIINNKTVWMSETYTPIKDVTGNVYKIIKIAFDITDFVNKKQ